MNREVSYENMKALEEDNVNLRMESERLASLNLAITLEWREELNKVRGERDLYRETIREFLSTVLTIKLKNQPDWMEYLAERIDEVCEVIGEEDRFAYNPRNEAILPFKR